MKNLGFDSVFRRLGVIFNNPQGPWPAQSGWQAGCDAVDGVDAFEKCTSLGKIFKTSALATAHSTPLTTFDKLPHGPRGAFFGVPGPPPPNGEIVETLQKVLPHGLLGPQE